MKKALILGVGSAQADAIRYLKESGWLVIGCSYRCEGRGLAWVDQFELIDITDHTALKALARRENVDLVYSIGSDLAMPAVAKVADNLGLPTFVNNDTVELLQNKIKLRQFLGAHNISPVKHRKILSEFDLEEWNSFPAIVKPADCQGQRGVFRADSRQEIKAMFRKSLSFSRSGTVIVEELLEGPEISVNAFVIDSRVVFSEISDRLVVEGYCSGIPQGHILPARKCIGEAACETKILVERCIQALRIEHGPVYFQIKLTPKGPRIIEIAARLDGCHIWRLIHIVTGVNLLETTLSFLMGDNAVFSPRELLEEPHYLGFLLSPPYRIFRQADYQIPAWALYQECYYQNGELIRPVNGFLEKVGYYLDVFSDRELLASKPRTSFASQVGRKIHRRLSASKYDWTS